MYWCLAPCMYLANQFFRHGPVCSDLAGEMDALCCNNHLHAWMMGAWIIVAFAHILVACVVLLLVANFVVMDGEIRPQLVSSTDDHFVVDRQLELQRRVYFFFFIPNATSQLLAAAAAHCFSLQIRLASQVCVYVKPCACISTHMLRSCTGQLPIQIKASC